MSKVVCIGEAIVDFIPNGDRFVSTAGGAPANVSVGVARLTTASCYLGKMSCDAYGFFLYDNMRALGVDMSYVSRCSKPTPLSFVSLKNGERAFSFKRDDTADLNLCQEDVPQDLFERGDVLHFCSVCLVPSPAKQAHKRAIELAKESGAIVSFDVNLRPSLFENKEQMMLAVCEFLPCADVLKLSIEELLEIGNHLGLCGEDETIKNLFLMCPNCQLMFITRGADGATCIDNFGRRTSHKAHPSRLVDTTGAGDCFVASVLSQIANRGVDAVKDDISTILDFALCACSIQIENYGAMRSMPTLSTVQTRLANNGH